MHRLVSLKALLVLLALVAALLLAIWGQEFRVFERAWFNVCLLYTSDAADE